MGERLARRVIREGESYTIDDDVDLGQVTPAEEPPAEIQGEPWGWTKPGEKPRGWRADGNYDGTH